MPAKPDCALCGQPYHQHNIGSITTCPVIATYRPQPPAADAGEVRTEVVVERIETVTGDYMQDEGEPIWRVRIGIQCADFEHEQAARNFAAAIRKLGS